MSNEETKSPAGRGEATDAARGNLTPDELIQRLRSALARDGDFPASAKIVSELRQLTSDPKTTAAQVTEVILREPSLGTRVLHLVNSSFYRRAKPIMTVSQAVMQIGMRPLAEMCAGLVLLQKFVPAARQGGSFANCLRKTVITSLLSSALADPAITPPSKNPIPTASRAPKTDEFGYLAGSFAELGTLLLAYYFPQLYDAAVKRAESKKVSVTQGIREITGLSAMQLSIEVIDALQLPGFYRDVLASADRLSGVGPGTLQKVPPGMPPVTAQSDTIARAVCASSLISNALVSGKNREGLDQALTEAKTRFNLEPKGLTQVVGQLPTLFKDHCAAIDLQLPALPEYVAALAKAEGSAEKAEKDTESDTQLSHYINEIRQAVEGREPTSSIITSVMESIAWGLNFDRVVLLLCAPGKTRLTGRLALGDFGTIDPKTIVRPLGPDAPMTAPDARAARESRPVFQGDPIFEGGWPLLALPIGFGPRNIGVIYADRVSSSGAGVADISAPEQAAVGILAELLHRSIESQA